MRQKIRQVNDLLVRNGYKVRSLELISEVESGVFDVQVTTQGYGGSNTRKMRVDLNTGEDRYLW